jgi:hypothetical protein
VLGTESRVVHFRLELIRNELDDGRLTRMKVLYDSD